VLVAPDDYDHTLAEVCAAIMEARVDAQVAVVSELALLLIDWPTAPVPTANRLTTTIPCLHRILNVKWRPIRTCSASSAVSTLEAYLLGLAAGFALAGSPYRHVTAGGVVLIDLLFFHIPTDRYVAILVDNEGPMDYLVDGARFLATLLDATARRDLNDTVGIAILANKDGVTIRHSYSNATDATTKLAMPREDQLATVLSRAVGVLPI
jgi:YhcG PDDEXK nuclease domain